MKEYGKGYSKQNIYRMSQVAKEFSKDELFSQPARIIPWFTLIEILHKSKSHEEMLWYIQQTHSNGWSRSMVINQIALKAYERSLINPVKTEVINKSKDLTNELFKDTYVFDFIDEENIKTEKDIKNQMIDNIIKFLNELGPVFSLVGKEYKLITPTNKEFFLESALEILAALFHKDCIIYTSSKSQRYIDDLKKVYSINTKQIISNELFFEYFKVLIKINEDRSVKFEMKRKKRYTLCFIRKDDNINNKSRFENMLRDVVKKYFVNKN